MASSMASPQLSLVRFGNPLVISSPISETFPSISNSCFWTLECVFVADESLIAPAAGQREDQDASAGAVHEHGHVAYGFARGEK